MWVVERDLAQRGLIVQRAPAALRPRTEEPRAALGGPPDEPHFVLDEGRQNERPRTPTPAEERKARIAAGLEKPVNPATAEIAEAELKKMIVRVLEACRS